VSASQRVSESEIERFVRSKRDWIDDENKRKQHFREVLAGGDRAAVLCMIHNLYRHKLTQAAAGRKFHLSDETFLHDAQKMLRSEFSVILGIPQSQVDDYILSKIQKK
jgi:CarD family transcriptional regulator